MFQVIVKFIISADKDVLFVRQKDSNEYDLPGYKAENSEEITENLTKNLHKLIGLELLDFNIYNINTFTEEQSLEVIFYVGLKGKVNPKLSEKFLDYTWKKPELLENSLLTKSAKKALAEFIDKKEVKKTTKRTEVKLYTDGGSRGNPGPSALGFVIYDSEDNVVEKGSKYLGITTNNQAEYQAVRAGLEVCVELGASKVDVYMDSQLVANQMNGIYKIKNRELWPIHQSITKIMENFDSGVSFTYIPREINKEADSMVNYELDKKENSIKNKV